MSFSITNRNEADSLLVFSLIGCLVSPCIAVSTSYPQYGSGGARQLVPTETINITTDKIDILPSK
ncbi:hypothetical protein THO17_03650 [Marinomonas sp. THO17]